MAGAVDAGLHSSSATARKVEHRPGGYTAIGMQKVLSHHRLGSIGSFSSAGYVLGTKRMDRVGLASRGSAWVSGVGMVAWRPFFGAALFAVAGQRESLGL
jgi:hypothetical protein